MAWHDILTRNIGWKAVSMLLAVIIWNAINQVQSSNDPNRFKGQTLTENRLDNTAIIPLANTPASTNRVNIIQAYDVRVLKLPDDPTRYILEPSQVTLTLGSDADPAPDLTSPTAVKVLLDPTDIPPGVIVTNKQVRVLVPEGTIIKGINPERVRVTRVVAPPYPPAEDEPAKKDSGESDEDSKE
jgi:hypothetical protein